jgi:hypothetical protein
VSGVKEVPLLEGQSVVTMDTGVDVGRDVEVDTGLSGVGVLDAGAPVLLMH